MAAEVTMPKMGYDMEEGTILQWLKAEGDTVKKGDVLGEIETGKVNIEIEAFDEGVLRKILVGEGQTVPVGTPIAVIAGADEQIDFSAYEAKGESAPAAEGEGRRDGANGQATGRRQVEGDEVGASDGSDDIAGGQEGGGREGAERRSPNAVGRASADTAVDAEVAAAADAGDRLRASPLARRVAAEHEFDLRRVEGSGPQGRVVRDDVMAAIESGVADGQEQAADGAASERVDDTAARPVKVEAEDERQPMSGMRRTIARRLSESWRAAPHIFLTMPIEMDALLDLRSKLNDGGGEDEAKISVNDLLVKASAIALRRHPRINVSWDDGERVQRARVNVGVAVALDDGLMTITITDADQKALSTISAEVRDKATRAREGKLTADDMATPSTFTLTNLGMYGLEEFTAIINPPEAAILAIGAAQPEAVVRNGEIVVRNVMRVTLSADHRVVDGATAAEFVVTLKDLIQQPVRMLI